MVNDVSASSGISSLESCEFHSKTSF